MTQPRTCPECGSEVDEGVSICLLCRAPLSSTPPGDFPPVASEPSSDPTSPDENPFLAPREPHIRPQFSLGSLMLVMTLISVNLAILVVAPGIGIAVAVIVVPALIQTAVTAARRRARGQPMSPADKFSLFAAALGGVLLTLLATGVAFYGTCWVGFFAGAAAGSVAGAKGYDGIGWGLLVGTILGGIVGLIVAFFVIRMLVRSFRRRKN